MGWNRGVQGEWASIGLADMFNAGGAVASETLSQEGGTAEAELMVRFFFYRSFVSCWYSISLSSERLENYYSCNNVFAEGA